MAGEQYDVSEDQAAPAPETPAAEPETVISPAEKELVAKWLKRIRAAKKHWKPVFDRMTKCQQIAAHGAYKEWLDDESRYVVPVLNRHINQAVSQLYARNPQAVASPRRRLYHSVWDGTTEQPAFVGAQAMLGDPAAAQMAMQIQQDIVQAAMQKALAERMAKTQTILYAYQIDEQPFNFKTQVKALVRRVKVNGVAYAKADFVREMEPRPEITAIIEDTTLKIAEIERMAEELGENEDTSEYDAEKLRLETLLADVMRNPDRVVREQVIFDYPRANEVILDPRTRHLKSLLGARWLALSYTLTAEEIEDVYGVNIETAMSPEVREAHAMLAADDPECRTYAVYEVQDKASRQRLTVCEAYEGFLRSPEEPEIFLERFFNIIPLVFNEIEKDDEIYPPSDVWVARHMQFEYNRSREGLREHRIAARPYWLTARGRLQDSDKSQLSAHAAHAIVEVTPTGDDKPLSSIVEPGPTAAIDPNLYETEGIYVDMQRSVGTQEANLGGTSGATATESSIAENSRMSSLSDNADDLDDMLTELARMTGQIMAQMFTKERVIEIVGPGAAWPDAPQNRKQLADEIILSVRAGSSGRPNQAAQLANTERAWPALSQLPGINPEPLAIKYADLLDIDPDDLLKSGAMSIVAQNAMASKPPPAPPGETGPVPAAQAPAGEAGMDNAEQAPEATPPGQPEYSAPMY